MTASLPGIAEILAKNPLFHHLQADLLQHVAKSFDLLKFQENQVHTAEEAVYVVVEGQLKVIRHGEEIKCKFNPFDFFGFKSLFDDIKVNQTVIAENKPCVVYQLNASRFQELLKSHPQLKTTLLPHLAQHVFGLDSSDCDRSNCSTPVEVVDCSHLPSDAKSFKVKMFDAKPYQVKYFAEQNELGGFNYNIEYLEEKLTPETVRTGIASGAHAVCVFVHDHVNKEVIKSLSEQGTHLVALRCAGMDAVDIKECDAREVSVVRVPSYSPNAIAEHAVALMMSLNRKLIWANTRVHSGDFSLDGLVGFDMKGKTAGVVGTGKIGACLVSILLGFGCKVVCYDVYKNPTLLANPLVSYVEFDDLLRQCDIISIHTPLLPSTVHMINSETIAKMKRGVMLINTSRGPLIDTSALIEGLKSGQIGSCGLDVVEGENAFFYSNHSEEVMTDDHIGRLLSFSNNVIMTAHQAFLTQEALREISLTTLRNIQEYHQGKRLKFLTNSANN
jgi:lactate dehydrogenase-like 2-hydroxyacid dehydrogenase